MPVTRELSVTYAGETFGGSSARQITGYTIDEADWQGSRFEFEFITSAASDAAFKTEIDAIRTAFRTPRGDLVVTQNGQDLISWKQSNNTGFDANPVVVKDGDPADTGLSRHFRIRIDFGQPADKIASVEFRRYSTVNVVYDSSRRRTVTISGIYTANSTDGSTGSFAQYRSKITNYGTTVVNGIDGAATWEVIGEPSVQRNETDKVTNFSIVFGEIIHNQSTGTVNDAAIVDPVMNIVREKYAPGDSTTGGFSFGGAGGPGAFNAGPNGNTTGGTTDTTGVMDPAAGPGNPGQTTTLQRPMRIIVTYQCGIDQTVTKDITAKWKSTIRPFLIAEAGRVAGVGLTLLKESPGFQDYGNRIDATMEFIAYMSAVIEQKITVQDQTAFGKILSPVTSKDPYAYYEQPGPALRQRIVNIAYKQIVGDAQPETVLDGLVVESAATVSGLIPSDGWMPVSNKPAVATVKQGLDGGKEVFIAEVTIERVAQRRNKVTASVANAGGVTGAGLT